MISGVAFDIGETLIDETRIWSRWASRLDVPVFTFCGVLGGMAALDRSHREVFEFFHLGFDLEAEMERWRAEDPDGLRENFDAADLYPDVRACFADLANRGIKVVVAGNQPVPARRALEAMALGVDAILISAELGVEKPDSEFFARIVDTVAIEPSEILYVGDRLDNDVLPARAAGMNTALIRRGPWGYLHAVRPEATQADHVIDGLDEVLGLVVGGE